MKKENDEGNSSKQARTHRLNSLGWYLKVLGTHVNLKMEESLESLGLTLIQFAIIMTLLEEDGLTQVDIGEKIILPPYATSRNIDKLESCGYVQRCSHSSSRRSYRVLLTDQGRALQADLYAATNKTNDQFLTALTEKQRDELFRLLGILTSKWVFK